MFSYICELTLFVVFGDDRVILYTGAIDDAGDVVMPQTKKGNSLG